jgi:hypothetical protein
MFSTVPLSAKVRNVSDPSGPFIKKFVSELVA